MIAFSGRTAVSSVPLYLSPARLERQSRSQESGCSGRRESRLQLTMLQEAIAAGEARHVDKKRSAKGSGARETEGEVVGSRSRGKSAGEKGAHGWGKHGREKQEERETQVHNTTKYRAYSLLIIMIKAQGKRAVDGERENCSSLI